MYLFENREDITRWCIHFVRDRDPSDVPALDEDDFERNSPTYGPLEPDASAFAVLKNILYHSALVPGFAFRNGRTTIYGGAPVVCFTEMPVYQFAKHCLNRNAPTRTTPYGIAVLKSELHDAGGRPVIYGLSQDTSGKMISNDDYERIFEPEILPIEEQYRFVTYEPTRTPHSIDWTHEREWRWKPIPDEPCHLVSMQNAYSQIHDSYPALPLFRDPRESGYFTEIRVLVWTQAEAHEIAKKLILFADSETNDFSEPYSKEVLHRSAIVVLDRVITEVERNQNRECHRLEDLPESVLYSFKRPEPSAATLAKVSEAVRSAKAASEDAATEFLKIAARDSAGRILDTCGFAKVVSYESDSEIIEAMLRLRVARACWGSHYQIDAIGDIRGEQSMSYNEHAAEAAARVLTDALGIKFYCRSRLD